MTLSCDVAVIGAGTAGLAAERAARGAGAKTLLIDPEFSGTTCATVGCMPSKLLIAAADAAHAVRHAGLFGVDAVPTVDGRAVMERVRRLRDDFAGSVRKGIARLPEGVAHRACARFESEKRLALDDGEPVEARAIVLATGSRPAIPEPYRDLPGVFTNETLFDLKTLPESIAVLGAGPIGVELAQALARLGVRVLLFDKDETLAGLKDRAVSDALGEALQGTLELHLETEVEARASDEGIALSWSGGTADVERLLVAAGRPPAVPDMTPTGLPLDDHGLPEVDPETLRCGRSAIFLVGDVNGSRPVLHEASAEGTIAGANAASYPDVKPARRSVPFALTFTRPEAAEIGEIGAKDALVGEARYDEQGRARVEGRNHGLARLYAEPASGQITGASLCLPDGGHMAHLLAWAIQTRCTAADLLDLPKYHPTLEEGLTAALTSICRQCSLPRPWSRDDGPRPGAAREHVAP